MLELILRVVTGHTKDYRRGTSCLANFRIEVIDGIGEP